MDDTAENVSASTSEQTALPQSLCAFSAAPRLLVISLVCTLHVGEATKVVACELFPSSLESCAPWRGNVYPSVYRRGLGRFIGRFYRVFPRHFRLIFHSAVRWCNSWKWWVGGLVGVSRRCLYLLRTVWPQLGYLCPSVFTFTTFRYSIRHKSWEHEMYNTWKPYSLQVKKEGLFLV